MMNKIYNENCLETMGKMPDGLIDLTVTSPPYDGLRTYNGYSFDFENVAKELFRVTKDGGVVVWIVGDATVKGSESGTSFKQALFFKECGFNLHDTMIYQKSNYMPLTHDRYEQSFEYMFILSKGKPNAFNALVKENKTAGDNRKGTHRTSGDKLKSKNKLCNVKTHSQKSNIWSYSVGKGGSTNDLIAFNHPAIFPEKLANDHIVTWSNESELVYDPFMGSGTTAKMALLNNRNYIGSEISKEYCEIINKRLEQHISQTSLFAAS